MTRVARAVTPSPPGYAPAMRVPLHQVDAFTTEPFAGNPAAVVQLSGWPDDALLQSVAAENNLSETAFAVPAGTGCYELRWFTPGAEVPLCGHATLATAHVLFGGRDAGRDDLSFLTRESGVLTVSRSPAGGMVMDLPARPVVAESVDPRIADVVGIGMLELHANHFAYVAVVADDDAVRAAVPDPMRVLELDRDYLMVTAPGRDCDFVSRFFAPAVGVPEDPVTGSAHCSLAPFWSERLGKSRMHARQLSARGGELTCEVRGNRVLLTGHAVTVIEGTLELPITDA